MGQNATITAPQTYARFAGFNYLLIFVLAIFANFFVLSKLMIDGNADATTANIIANESQFRLAIAAFFIVLICDVFISWALYLILRKTDPHLSLLAVLFRLTYTVAQVGVLLNLVSALEFTGAPEPASALAAINNAAWPYYFLSEHNTGFTLTLIFFGLHLLLLGHLVIRSTFLPSVIGLLVMVAGAGYIVDGFNKILDLGYFGISGAGLYVVILPALLGEGSLMLWLLIRGLNREKWLAA